MIQNNFPKTIRLEEKNDRPRYNAAKACNHTTDEQRFIIVDSNFWGRQLRNLQST